MAIDAPPSTFFSPWPDRLRHSAIILLAAGLALAVLVAFGELSLLRAAAVFICIAAAALVPWRLHNVVTSREDVRGVHPVETAVVSAVVPGMPDPAARPRPPRPRLHPHSPPPPPCPAPPQEQPPPLRLP